MNKKSKLILILLTIFVLGCSTQKRGQTATPSGVVMPKEVLEKINSSVFEVVKLKPVDDDLTYEKELPLNDIPYTIRKDKYIPIGTAFAISEDRFVTAAHVLGLEYETQNSNYYIRSKNDKVYKINNIYKYSSQKDFAVFDVEGITVENRLKINTNPEVNQSVVSVGNALGEDIVIRSGYFTSKTPEEENGEWSWIRFSAPASPGNSGGPLLNKEGDIIGVVLRKSPNENLNYALPIGMVDESPENKAVVHYRLKYGLQNFREINNSVYDYTTDLPKSFDKLQKELVKNYKKDYKKNIDKLIDDYEKDMFPNGENSLELLYSNWDSVFPSLISQKEDKKWGLFEPKEINETQLKEEGRVSYGIINGLILSKLKRPKDISLQKLYEDGEIFFDYLLEGIPVYRNVANESIRITSAGKEDFKSFYIDEFGRKWIIRKWNFEYNDTQFLTMSLPVPDGVISMISFNGTYNTDYMLYDFKKLAKYVYCTYSGDFNDWKEYGKQDKYVPQVLKNSDFKFETDTLFYKNDNIRLGINDNILDFNDESLLLVHGGYYKKGNIYEEGISEILISEDESYDNLFYYERHKKPVKALSRKYFDWWEDVAQAKYPYNEDFYFSEGSTIIGGVLEEDFEDEGYTLTMVLEGKKDEVIEDRFEKLKNSVELLKN
ncbi:MAG: S1 family peptidase [Fusobacteriota bacterium]